MEFYCNAVLSHLLGLMAMLTQVIHNTNSRSKRISAYLFSHWYPWNSERGIDYSIANSCLPPKTQAADQMTLQSYAN